MQDSFVEGAIRELHDLYLTGRAKQRRYRQTSRILTFATLGLFAAFLLAFYSKANSMYAMENFHEPLQKQAHILATQLAPNLETLLAEAAPVYAKEAIAKFEEALPTVREASQNELKRLSTSLRVRAENQMNATLQRIAEKNRRKLQEHFPSLASVANPGALEEKWKKTIEEDTIQVIEEFRTKYTRDVQMLRNSLEGFRSSRFEEMGEDELTRYFIHLWLMRLDRLILEGDLGGEFDNE